MQIVNTPITKCQFTYIIVIKSPFPTKCQLPDDVPIADGRTLHRPPAWAAAASLRCRDALVAGVIKPSRGKMRIQCGKFPQLQYIAQICRNQSSMRRKRQASISTAKMPSANERLVACATWPIIGGPMKYPRNPIDPTNVNADAAGIDFVLFAFE